MDNKDRAKRTASRKGPMMRFNFDTRSADDYETFLQIRRCPMYSFRGTSAIVPDEYAKTLGVKVRKKKLGAYVPHGELYDYQRDIAAMAIQKRKFAIFAECGLGKTLMFLEYARYVAQYVGGKVLIVSPLMVCDQTCEEYVRWYGEDNPKIGQLAASDVQQWMNAKDGPQIGIVNFEAIRDGLSIGNVVSLIIDEASMLKSHYGAWGTRLIDLGAGLNWKLTGTGTPAPNDRIEYANQAVFLDRAKTVNEFLASYFINRGETQNRWELKPHALKPFYRSLADWSIFLTNPCTYGWKDNVGVTPPIHIHIDHIDLTPEQRKAAQSLTGSLITNNIGGIGDRGKLSQIAKGKNGMPTNKPAFIRAQVDSWPDESTIIWCRYNDEQDQMERTFPEAVSISGDTKDSVRRNMIKRFQRGEVKTLISKLKILGFGLNLQVCTRQIFNGLNDSWEEFHQGVKRSNRIGSTRDLNVHIPVTELEVPFIENVLRKAHRIEADTIEQEALFKELGHDHGNRVL